MRTYSAIATAALLLQLSPPSIVSASPVALDSSTGSISIPLVRRTDVTKDMESFLRKVRKMKSRYGPPSVNAAEKRATSSDLQMLDQQGSEYTGVITVGTPPTPFSVVLDSGSSDLILATSPCTGCLSSTPRYTPSSSSTSKTSTTPFDITYGSGAAQGVLVSDVVSIAGFTVPNQIFAACDILQTIVTGTISGLLGLGWQGISSSGAVPLVQALSQSGNLTSQVFAFGFDAYSASSTSSSNIAPGGTMTIGATDSSLFTGSINWNNIVTPTGYWAIALDDVTVSGRSVGLSTRDAVIDTGTSLIGVPASAIRAIYSQIPGSAPVTLAGDSSYYGFPCTSTVNVAFTFGGISYAVSPDQFNAGALDTTGRTCVGAVFAMAGGSNVEWIFGDAFLVNVYSAFRFSSPPAVGFASLGSGGISSTTSNSTTNSTTSTPSGTSSGSGASSTARASSATPIMSAASAATLLAGVGFAALVLGL